MLSSSPWSLTRSWTCISRMYSSTAELARACSLHTCTAVVLRLYASVGEGWSVRSTKPLRADCVYMGIMSPKVF